MTTTLATCSLNQWALDFEGNMGRIKESIDKAAGLGARLRTGPELEIPGYGCQDHFLEPDATLHSWEVLKELLEYTKPIDMIIDVGMPVLHRGVLYNSRIFLYKGEILLVRPKQALANDGNYRETRWFTPWVRLAHVERYVLPDMFEQRFTTIGDGLVRTRDTLIGTETCEELFTPQSPHIRQGLQGVEIIVNGSGSHHELRKLHKRLDLIREASRKVGGAYLYANQQGCDGDRLYYDGCAMVVSNGQLVAQGSQFSLHDVEVVTATVDLDEVRSRQMASSSRNDQAVLETQLMPEVFIDTSISGGSDNLSTEIPVSYHRPEEEIALGPACWLWDYVRRCRATGFFVPLSGGIDSCATAIVVYSMCTLVVKEAGIGNQQVIEDARRIANASTGSVPADYVPTDPREFCSRVFSTCYMGTENSSKETRSRAKRLAEQIGSYHTDLNMDTLVSSVVSLFSFVTGKTPRFKVYGGTAAENLALQNIQARLRMILAYLFAQLIPWTRGGTGALLVLGSANVDESLRGYLTKYDASSADLNPIGSISKMDLKRFIGFAETYFSLPILSEFLHATPTAELEPFHGGYVQSDEADMGVTYAELSILGTLRKVQRMGPWSMYKRLLRVWSDVAPADVAAKVRLFFTEYARNRHKMTTITPAYHAESYSPEDNRFDLRPFLYNIWFPWQYKKIKADVDSRQ